METSTRMNSAENRQQDYHARHWLKYVLIGAFISILNTREYSIVFCRKMALNQLYYQN